MKQFTGFPAKMQFTPVPNFFFSNLLPQISDIAELKTTLHILSLFYRKRGFPRFTTYRELLTNKSLMSGLNQGEVPPEEVLHRALEMATQRGTILHIALDKEGMPEDVYFLNNKANREAIAKIQNGEIHLSGLKIRGQAYIETEKQPDIFTVYEENIGMLTPIIADELREAEKLYPITWINEAIKEAVTQNKRKWSYISAILERWSSEGKSDGTYKRDFKKTDPDKYIKGKYGHMVQR